MIVRIMTEGQFELGGSLLESLRRADEALLEAVRNSDGAAFRQHLEEAVALIRQGRRLDSTQLKESDLVLPAPDMTVEEAHRLFDHHDIVL